MNSITLRLDFRTHLVICAGMAEQSNDQIRTLFTEIGCIMEDASIIALIWDRASLMPTQVRYQQLLEAHGKIDVALSTIKSAIDKKLI